MISFVDDRLRWEAKRYGFRFTCESCAWFEADSGTCSHEFPNEEHRNVDLDVAAEVLFCKEFELA